MPQFNLEKVIQQYWESATVHRKLIEDRVRNNAYKKAIEKYVRANITAIDVGCGTGILSFFAARAGCKKIFAVDRSNLIDYAREAAKLNGFSNKIDFIQSDIFSLKLKSKVDLIIHDQIGTFFWNEDMQGKIAFLRERYLKPGGKILPGACTLFLVPGALAQTSFNPYLWKTRHYGFDFGNFGKLERQQFLDNLNPISIMLKNSSSFIARPKVACHLDFLRNDDALRPIELSFRVRSGRALCTAIIGFFKISLDDQIAISTKPGNVQTNWGQFAIPLGNQREVIHGDLIRLSLIPAIDSAKWHCSVEYS